MLKNLNYSVVVYLIVTLLILNFRNSKFDLKDNFVNNKKTQISKFQRDKMM